VLPSFCVPLKLLRVNFHEPVWAKANWLNTMKIAEKVNLIALIFLFFVKAKVLHENALIKFIDLWCSSFLFNCGNIETKRR
jgi:hypothetical protein